MGMHFLALAESQCPRITEAMVKTSGVLDSILEAPLLSSVRRGKLSPEHARWFISQQVYYASEDGHVGCLRHLSDLSRSGGLSLHPLFDYSTSWLPGFPSFLMEALEESPDGKVSPTLVEYVEFQHQSSQSLFTGIASFLFCYLSYGMLMDLIGESWLEEEVEANKTAKAFVELNKGFSVPLRRLMTATDLMVANSPDSSRFWETWETGIEFERSLWYSASH